MINYITGIPANFAGGNFNIHFRTPATAVNVAFGNASGIGTDGTADITISGGTGGFLIEGGTFDMEAVLWETGWTNHTTYRLSSRTVVPGENIIPLGDFTLIAPVTVTVTGIPAEYATALDTMNLIMLNHGTTTVAASLPTVTLTAGQTSAEFATGLMNAGAFDLTLHFSGERTRYRLPLGRILNLGNNVIPYSEFVYEESITVTLENPGAPFDTTTILVRLVPQGGHFTDTVAEGSVWGAGTPPLEVFLNESFVWWALPFTTVGTYDVYFHTWNADWALIPSVTFVPGNNVIDMAGLSPLPPVTITVTGIPTNFDNGASGNGVILELIYENNTLFTSHVHGFTHASQEFTFPSLVLGTYRVRIGMRDDDISGWNWQQFHIPSREITATGLTIPFADFVPGP